MIVILRVNAKFMAAMNNLKEDQNAVRQCNSDNKLELLKELSSSLDKCQKNLSDYLQSKRNCFPR